MMWTMGMGGVGTDSEKGVKVKFGHDVESNDGWVGLISSS